VRIVIDTNVLISAIFWTGKPKQLLNHVRRQKITFVTSNQLLDELRQVLVRQDKPFHLQDNEADQVVEALRGCAEVVESHSRLMGRFTTIRSFVMPYYKLVNDRIMVLTVKARYGNGF
jgi:putative PIN family toxin of toxin-antitoxin system